MDSDKHIALIRGLITLKAAEPYAYECLMFKLEDERKDCLQQLVFHDDEKSIYRLQGAIKAIEALQEYINDPNKLIQTMEQGIG